MNKRSTQQDISELIKELVIIAFGSVFLTYVFAYLLNVILFYFIMPVLIWLLPSLAETFQNQSIAETDLFYNVVFEICLVLAFAISMFTVSPFSDNRSDAFTKYTYGQMIPHKEAIFHHFTHHWQMELLINFMIVLNSFVLSKIFGVAPFSILYRIYGIWYGIFISSLLTAIIQFVCILPSQKQWFINYYLGEG